MYFEKIKNLLVDCDQIKKHYSKDYSTLDSENLGKMAKYLEGKKSRKNFLNYQEYKECYTQLSQRDAQKEIERDIFFSSHDLVQPIPVAIDDDKKLFSVTSERMSMPLSKVISYFTSCRKSIFD